MWETSVLVWSGSSFSQLINCTGVKRYLYIYIQWVFFFTPWNTWSQRCFWASWSIIIHGHWRWSWLRGPSSLVANGGTFSLFPWLTLQRFYIRTLNEATILKKKDSFHRIWLMLVTGPIYLAMFAMTPFNDWKCSPIPLPPGSGPWHIGHCGTTAWKTLRSSHVRNHHWRF